MRQCLLKAAQSEVITENAEPGDNAANGAGNFGELFTSCRIRDVNLDRGQTQSCNGADQGRTTGHEPGGIENGRIESTSIRIFELVDDFALHVRVEDLDLHSQ